MNFFFTCISFFSIHNDNYDEDFDSKNTMNFRYLFRDETHLDMAPHGHAPVRPGHRGRALLL